MEANTVRRLILERDRRFPGLGHQIDVGMALAIDGEIFEDACLTTLNPDLTIDGIAAAERRTWSEP